MGCGASSQGQQLAMSPGYNVSNDKAPLIPHVRTVETSDMQTSMSDFSALLVALPEVPQAAAALDRPPRDVPVSIQEVQTDPWDPMVVKEQQNSLDFKPKKKDPLNVDDIWVQVRKKGENGWLSLYKCQDPVILI